MEGQLKAYFEHHRVHTPAFININIIENQLKRILAARKLLKILTYSHAYTHTYRVIVKITETVQGTEKCIYQYFHNCIIIMIIILSLH